MGEGPAGESPRQSGRAAARTTTRRPRVVGYSFLDFPACRGYTYGFSPRAGRAVLVAGHRLASTLRAVPAAPGSPSIARGRYPGRAISRICPQTPLFGATPQSKPHLVTRSHPHAISGICPQTQLFRHAAEWEPAGISPPPVQALSPAPDRPRERGSGASFKCSRGRASNPGRPGFSVTAWRRCRSPRRRAAASHCHAASARRW
jgi:hypothetical protein